MIPIRMPDQRTVVSARVRRHAVVARGARSPARGTAATNSMTASTCRVAPDSAAEHASRGTEVLPPIDALGQGRPSRQCPRRVRSCFDCRHIAASQRTAASGQDRDSCTAASALSNGSGI